LLLLGAVASHKFVVGFCLGAELLASAPGRLCAHIVCVLLFSGGSVAGIGIGAGLETVQGIKDSIAIPIMQVRLFLQSGFPGDFSGVFRSTIGSKLIFI
jgi:solute carrier family 39 (zinc transporter), member 1/2/3